MARELSRHCLCDECDGEDCKIYSEGEIEIQEKEKANRIASATLTEFSEWCNSRFVDRQIRDFKIYKVIE